MPFQMCAPAPCSSRVEVLGPGTRLCYNFALSSVPRSQFPRMGSGRDEVLGALQVRHGCQANLRSEYCPVLGRLPRL